MDAANNTQFSGHGCVESDPGPGGTGDVAGQHFCSRDLDETRAFLTHQGHHTRVPHSRDPFEYEVVGAASRALTAVQIKVAGRQAIRAVDRSPMLFLPLQAQQTFNIGRKAWQPDTSRALLVASNHEYCALAPAGAFLGLRIDVELLCTEISGRLLGRSRPLLLQSIEIPIDAARRIALYSIFDRMLAAAKGSHSWDVYGNVGAFETEVASWVAGLVIEETGARAAAAGSLQRVERLERWLDAHLGDDITLDQLCAMSGISSRSLQKLMLARYGQSPLEWVNARRLAAARARLLETAPGVPISMVAMDCGFNHLGRFSAAYRRAHGELPSATLAAARSQHHPPANLRI